MTKTGQVRVIFMAAAAALALGLAAMLAAGPAEAAFPGKNGKVFFQSDRDGNPHVYSMKPDGTGLSRLTFTSANTDPAVSPDGTRVAFVSTDNQLFVMNADGSGQAQLTTTSTSKREPAWSPDGSRIVYHANSFDVDGQTDLEIWTINADGTGRTQITNNTFPDQSPAWSPDGTKIAFVSARTGDTDRNVYIMNSDGTGQTSITPNSPTGCSPNCYQGHDDDPAWSPDGTKIAYVHTFAPNASGLPNIWTMDPNGANKTNIQNNQTTSGTQPAWSPDGTRIAYVGAVTTDRNIYAMNADGTGQGPIDTSTAHDIAPDWQQDSIPPQTTISSGPPSLTRSTTAAFGFASSETFSTFECSLDGAPFAGCSSPRSYAVGNGTHTFRVKATDVAGNADATPAVRTWTVDTIRPAIGGMSPRHGSVIRDATPTIRATVKDNRPLAKANIRLYVAGRLIPATRYAYNPSTGALVHNSPRLTDGRKTVRIVATDAAGNVGAKAWTFTIR